MSNTELKQLVKYLLERIDHLDERACCDCCDCFDCYASSQKHEKMIKKAQRLIERPK